MTDTRTLYDKFLKIEENLHLFNQKIDDVYFWERIRFEVFIKLVYSDAGVPITPKTKSRSLLGYYFSSIVNIMRNPLLARKKKFLFVGTPRRVKRKDGYWWDIYIDEIIDSLQGKTISFEYSSASYSHFAPPKTTNIRYLDFIEFIAHILRILGYGKIKLTLNHRKLLATVRNAIKREFGVDIDIEHRTRLILEKRKSRLWLYTYLLRNLKPKVTVVVVSYGKEDIIEACKSMKIPVLELQHGVIHVHHLGYSYQGNIRRKLTFPDYLLSFGDYWSNYVEYPIPRERILPVGYPLMDEERHKYKNTKRKKQIVFISQQLSGEALSKFALELSKIKGNPYNIVFKLQPQECETWKEAYPWLIGANMEVVDKRSDILHKILAESVAQVGVSSTAIFEGMAFGLTTYLVDGAGVEIFDPLLKEGLVHKAVSPEHLLEHLKEQSSESSFETDYIFKRGATKSIIEIIKRMSG